jgi:N-glycosylase/DNA lyase
MRLFWLWGKSIESSWLSSLVSYRLVGLREGEEWLVWKNGKTFAASLSAIKNQTLFAPFQSFLAEIQQHSLQISLLISIEHPSLKVYKMAIKALCNFGVKVKLGANI